MLELSPTQLAKELGVAPEEALEIIIVARAAVQQQQDCAPSSAASAIELLESERMRKVSVAVTLMSNDIISPPFAAANLISSVAVDVARPPTPNFLFSLVQIDRPAVMILHFHASVNHHIFRCMGSDARRWCSSHKAF